MNLKKTTFVHIATRLFIAEIQFARYNGLVCAIGYFIAKKHHNKQTHTHINTIIPSLNLTKLRQSWSATCQDFKLQHSDH